MKSTFRLIIGTATLCLTVLLSACGQPGPLYLPNAPGVKSVKGGKATAPSRTTTPTPATPGTVPPMPATPVPVTPSPVPQE